MTVPALDLRLRIPYATGVDLRRIAATSIRRLCEPLDDIAVTDFAARHRILPETSASPGPYDPSVVPFVRRPQDLMGDVATSMVVLCWASQLTKSTLIENALMYRMKRMPSPIVIVLPKIEAAEAWAKERFRPMVHATPLLKKLILLGRSTESTLRYYKFPGGFAFIASAQSATELAQRSSPFLFLDEVDRMVHIAGEGNPVEIVLRRQGAADIGLAVLTSTPRDAETTIIWPYLEGGTFEYFHVPCPHCGHRQALTWKNLRWDRDKPSTAFYVCAGAGEDGCGAVIQEKHKHEMLAGGDWVATNPEADYPSFHLNALYSPFAKSSWAELAKEWQRSQGKPTDLQVFVNTRLAELWEETKEAADPNALIARLEPTLVEGLVPRGVAVLTAGVDVQGNRLEVYIWGWGAGLESWLIASYILPGDPQREPDQPGSVWADLDQVLFKRFAHEDSNGHAFLGISVAMVDSGHARTQVYRYTHARRGGRVYACKGVGGDNFPLLATKPTLQGREKVILYSIGVDQAKTEFIRSHLLEPKPGPGYVHLGDWVTEDQCRQLVSEKRRRKLLKGKVSWGWVKKREEDPNEALDCRNYARGGVERLGPKEIRRLGATAAAITEKALSFPATPGSRPDSATPRVGLRSPGRRMLSQGVE